MELCGNFTRFNISFYTLFYICTWKIAKLELTTSRAQSNFRDNVVPL